MHSTYPQNGEMVKLSTVLSSIHACRGVKMCVSNRGESFDCHLYRIVKASRFGRFLRCPGGCNWGTLINQFSRRLGVPKNSRQLKGNEVGLRLPNSHVCGGGGRNHNLRIIKLNSEEKNSESLRIL